MEKEMEKEKVSEKVDDTSVQDVDISKNDKKTKVDTSELKKTEKTENQKIGLNDLVSVEVNNYISKLVQKKIKGEITKDLKNYIDGTPVRSFFARVCNILLSFFQFRLLPSIGMFVFMICVVLVLQSVIKFFTNIKDDITLSTLAKVEIQFNQLENGSFSFVENEGASFTWNLFIEECTSLYTEKIQVRCLVHLEVESMFNSIEIHDQDRVKIFEKNNFWKVVDVFFNEKDIQTKRGKDLLAKKSFFIESNIHSLVEFNRFRKMRFSNFIGLFPSHGYSDHEIKLFQERKKLNFNYFYMDEKIFSAVIFQNYKRKSIIKYLFQRSIKIKNGGPRGMGKSLVFYYLCKLYRGVFSTCKFDGGAGSNDNTVSVSSIINENSLKLNDFPGDARQNNETGEDYGLFFSDLVQTLFISGCGESITLDDIKNDAVKEWDAIECNYPLRDLQNKKIRDITKWGSIISQQYHAQIAVFSNSFIIMEYNEMEKENSKKVIDMYNRVYNQIFEKVFKVKTNYLIVHDKDKVVDISLQNYIGRNLFKTQENVFKFKFCLPKKKLDCGSYNPDENNQEYLECLKCMSDNNRELGDLYLSTIKDAEECLNEFRPEWQTNIIKGVWNILHVMFRIVFRELYF